MVKSNFEKDIFKKLLWYYIFISIIAMLLISEPMVSFLALTIGTLLSCLRLFVMGKLADVIIYKPENKLLFNVFYILALIILYTTIVISAIWGLKFFVFYAIGSLLTNIVIYISTIFELINSFRKSYKEGEI